MPKYRFAPGLEERVGLRFTGDRTEYVEGPRAHQIQRRPRQDDGSL
jgi:hypothetical protein